MKKLLAAVLIGVFTGLTFHLAAEPAKTEKPETPFRSRTNGSLRVLKESKRTYSGSLIPASRATSRI